ncbi:MAG: ABC transporter permease, partial [Bacteroidia bacterium]
MLFLTLFKESFLFAIQALVTNKLRSFLSLLGITIGIFAIISVFTMTDSLEKKLRDSVKSMGDDVVFVQKWPWTFGPDYPWWKYMNRPVPTISELAEIQKQSKKSEASCFSIGTSTTVKYKSNSVENTNMICASHDYYTVKTFEIGEGRYFSEMESAGGRPVALIGSTVAEGLFGQEDPIGKMITVKGSKVSVIGVFKKEGESMLGNSMDAIVVIPIN